MSSQASCRCRECRRESEIRWGGGFRYVDRFCTSYGGWRSLRFAEDPRTWDAFLALSEVLQVPPAPGRPLRERQGRIAEATARLEARVQEVLGPCPCGGSFGGERPRCPGCGSEALELLGETRVDYD